MTSLKEPKLNSLSSIQEQPRQQLSDSKKGEQWKKDNMDFAEMFINRNSEEIRQSFNNKVTNYNLRINKINFSDVEHLCNPHKIDSNTFPDTFKHIGIGNNKINLLLGEERKRRNDFRVVLSSKDEAGISSKEQQMKEMWMKTIYNTIQQNLPQDKIEAELKRYDKYIRYSWQDIREQTATKLLKRELQVNDVKEIISDCFEDFLVCGEEIICIEELSNEVSVRKVNPLNFYTIGGHSKHIEESDIQVEFGYYPVGKIIDMYYKFLKPEQVKFLEQGYYMNKSNSYGNPMNRDYDISERYGNEFLSKIYTPSEISKRAFSGAFDTYGKVKVVKACWRSRRKVGNLKYYDEFGQELHRLVHSEYIPDEPSGEEVEWFWVNEWWKGTKIADDIYIDIAPIPFAGKSLTNYSKGSSPYVGMLASNNDQKVFSLMDMIKPLDYSYDIIYWKRDKEISTHLGDVLIYNEAMVPAQMDREKWMSYVAEKKFMPLNPFNEIIKGPSQGKSAGAFNQLTAQNVSFNGINSIKLYTEIMEDIENTISKISGVSPQREAQISTSEKVGNVERALEQSAHITEKWFDLHDHFKKKIYRKILDVAKYVYKKNPIKAQHVFDDMGIAVIESYDEFTESEYDVIVSNSGNEAKIRRTLEKYVEAAIHTGQASLSEAAKIALMDSTQALMRELEEAQLQVEEQQKARAEEQQKLQAQEAQNKAQAEERKYQHEHELKDKDIQVDIMKLEIEAMKAELSSGDSSPDDIRKQLDIMKAKIAQQKQDLEVRKQNEVERVNKVSERHKEEELRIKRKQANKPQATKKP